MIRMIFIGKTNRTLYQFIRYFITGGIAFLIDFALLFSLTEYLDFNYLVSAAIGFISGLIINYIISIKWVFPERWIRSKKLEFLLFMLIGIIGLGLNEFLMWFFTEVVLTYYLVSKILTATIVFFWNFGARKLLLFTKK